MMRFGMTWASVDKWGHRLHIPKRIMRPVCDMYELSLGIYLEQITPDYADRKRLPWWLRKK